MSILGAVVRIRPEHLEVVVPRLSTLHGADLALNPGDGRLVMVLEDAEVDGVVHGAAATLASIALWPEVLNTSLVFEYSGPDAPPIGGGAVEDYRAWRGSLKDWAGPPGDLPTPGS
ncbi:MAG TPA: chaperone NapD [Piscinibacter sp.]|nr:chaperone NapD [Piscinibacter sp.]